MARQHANRYALARHRGVPLTNILVWAELYAKFLLPILLADEYTIVHIAVGRKHANTCRRCNGGCCRPRTSTIPSTALQVVVTHMDKGAEGVTYHFAVKTDPGETLNAGSDFITIYNFGGLVEGSGKAPAGWEFSSPEFGRTPTWNGYPAVLPVDMPAMNNLTWTLQKAIVGGSMIEGFVAMTRATSTTEGEYNAQVTRSSNGKSSKQAILGQLATPGYAVQ